MDFDINQIKKRLHHRYPFIFIDKVLELEEGIRCTALKNVTYNEAFFQGHFPQLPIMPGVIILEALAQAGGILAYSSIDRPEEHNLLFTGMENVKFKKQVTPGDQLILKTKLIGRKMILWTFQGEAYIRAHKGQERLAAKATLKCALTQITLPDVAEN